MCGEVGSACLSCGGECLVARVEGLESTVVCIKKSALCLGVIMCVISGSVFLALYLVV